MLIYLVGKEERVKVTIVEAADLTPMRANGPADPCVKLTIGDSKIETPAVHKTLTPVVRLLSDSLPSASHHCLRADLQLESDLIP